MALSKETVAQLYVALFQRAAAKDELDSWYKWAEDNNADMNKLAGAMLYSAVQVAKSDEDAAKFYPDYANLGDTTVTADQAKAIIENVYSLLLGKDYTTDPEGIDGWVKNVVDNGGTYTALGDTLAGIVYVANQYANGELEATDDATKKAVEAFKNKTQAAVETAETIPTNDPTGDGKVDFDVFQNIVKVVTDDPATIDEAKKVIEDYTPKSFDLSDKKDEIVGNDAANTFKAVVSSLNSEATLNSGDKIDGKGGVDTLDIDMKGSFSGVGTDGYIKNVENINLTNKTSINRTFDATNVEGVEKYTLTGSENGNSISLANLKAAGIEIDLKDMSQTASISFDSNLDLTGTTDAMTFTIDNLGKADPTPDNKTDDATYTQISMSNIEDVTINTKEKESYVNLSGISSATDYTIKGDQNISINDVANGLKTFNAADNTGKVTATLTSVTGNTIKSIKTGSADDKITLNTAGIVASAEINLGEGSDTLVINKASGTVQPKMSGVETLDLKGVTSGQTFTLSGANTTGLEKIIVNANSTDNGNATFVNLGSQDLTVDAVKAISQTFQFDNSGSTTINFKDADATAAGPTTSNGTITLLNAQSATVNVEKAINAHTTLNLNKATNVTLNVDSALDSSNNEQTKFTGVLNAAKATDVTIDAKGVVDITNSGSSLAKAQNVTLNAENKTSTITLDDNAGGNDVDLSAASSVELKGNGSIALNNVGTNGTTPVD